MAQTNLNIKVDEKDKKNFEIFCSETGMNISVAINMFIKTVLREYKLPFEIKSDPFYSNNTKYLEKIIENFNNNNKTELQEILEDDE